MEECNNGSCSEDEGTFSLEKKSFTCKNTKVAARSTEGCFSGTAAQVNQACKDNKANCCTGTQACGWPDETRVTVCPNSCQGLKACWMDRRADGKNDYRVDIAKDACQGDFSCVQIGRGFMAQTPADSTVMENTCKGAHACHTLIGNVQKGSCLGDWACRNNEGDVGFNSCISSKACNGKRNGVGDYSCRGALSCMGAKGYVKNGSCTINHGCIFGAGAVADCVLDCRQNECLTDEGTFNSKDGSCQYLTADEIKQKQISTVSAAKKTVEGCFKGTDLEVTKACIGNGCCTGKLILGLAYES